MASGESCYVAVTYTVILKERSFAFYSIHENVAHGIVDAKTPRVVTLVNTTLSPITIRKRSRLGYIGERVEDGSIKSSWKAAFAVLSIASAITLANIVLADPNEISVNAEFSLDPITTAVAADIDSVEPIGTPAYSLSISQPDTESNERSDTYIGMVEHILDGDLHQADMAYANLVALDQLIEPQKEQQNVSPEDDAPFDEDIRLPPKFNELTMGIKRPEDLKETIVDGIHIYSEDASHAKAFEEIIKKHPALWNDEGLIDVPIDEQMKIPLVDGWQHHKLASRPYPLSIKDKAAVNRIYDKLHSQNRMRWAHEPGLFAHAVFVVYRSTVPDAKGRAVVDLRALNRVAVPDNYPLPLQSEVIHSLRSKNFISVIDATSFFHQFPVHPDYRDRFTVVTHRGIEQSIVALMGFKNSPAYVQRFMDKVLRPHQEFARAFVDDIVIFSETFEDHKRHLDEIFRLFVSKNIAIAPTKSFIGYPLVDLLGFRVNGFGYSTTAQKVKAFKDLVFPERLKALETYIGATGFLRHLIPYYAKLIEPLQLRKTALLLAGRTAGKVVDGNKSRRKVYCQTTTFQPTDAKKRSFEAIQAAICSENALFHFNPKQRLFLKIDGCTERGFGGIAFHLRPGYKWTPGTKIPLSQVLLICYLSRCLLPAETRYGPSEQEVGCLYWTVRKLRTII